MDDDLNQQLPDDAVPEEAPSAPVVIRPFPGFWQAVWLIARYFLFQLAIIVPVAAVDAIAKTHWSGHPMVFAAATLFGGILSIYLVCRRMEVSFLSIAGALTRPIWLLPVAMTVFGLVLAEMPIVIWVARLFPALLAKQQDFGLSQSLWAGFLIIVIIAPIMEESLFRGIIERGFIARYGSTQAIGLTAIMFGAVHFSALKLITTVSLGLLLGWLYVKFGTIWPGVFAHALNNSLAFFAVLGSKSKLTDKPDLGHFSWGEVVICMMGAILITCGAAVLRQKSRSNATAS